MHMLVFVFRKHCVKYKSYMASTTTSLSPHHSINKVDPCTTNRVRISCEKRKKPRSASSFRYSQTEKEKRAGSVLLTGSPSPLDSPHKSQGSQQGTEPFSHLAAFGQNWALLHPRDMSSGCHLGHL